MFTEYFQSNYFIRLFPLVKNFIQFLQKLRKNSDFHKILLRFLKDSLEFRITFRSFKLLAILFSPIHLTPSSSYIVKPPNTGSPQNLHYANTIPIIELHVEYSQIQSSGSVTFLFACEINAVKKLNQVFQSSV